MTPQAAQEGGGAYAQRHGPKSTTMFCKRGAIGRHAILQAWSVKEHIQRWQMPSFKRSTGQKVKPRGRRHDPAKVAK